MVTINKNSAEPRHIIVRLKAAVEKALRDSGANALMSKGANTNVYLQEVREKFNDMLGAIQLDELFKRPVFTDDLESNASESDASEIHSLRVRIDGWIEFINNEIAPGSLAVVFLNRLERDVAELSGRLCTPAQPEENWLLRKYADLFILLITAAGKNNYTGEQILNAIATQLLSHSQRRWVEARDGTYMPYAEETEQAKLARYIRTMAPEISQYSDFLAKGILDGEYKK